MSKKSLYSPEEKYQVISEVMNRHHSLKSIAKKHSLSWATIKDWIRKYNDDGIDRLSEFFRRQRSHDYEKFPMKKVVS